MFSGPLEMTAVFTMTYRGKTTFSTMKSLLELVEVAKYILISISRECVSCYIVNECFILYTFIFFEMTELGIAHNPSLMATPLYQELRTYCAVLWRSSTLGDPLRTIKPRLFFAGSNAQFDSPMNPTFLCGSGTSSPVHLSSRRWWSVCYGYNNNNSCVSTF